MGSVWPVENATIVAPRYFRATYAGSTAFIAHVRACWPVLPNFIPAR